jgi:hypothetical protein
MKLIDYDSLQNKYSWIIFILLTLFFNNLTMPFNKCIKPSLISYLLLLIHDAVFVYFLFGSLIFNNYIIHSIFLLLTLLNWYIFGKCIITIVNNHVCENNYDEKYINVATLIFNDNKSVIYLGSVMLLLYNLYNIYKK